jgi:ABC-type sugar transport system ATPase subunit
MMGNGSPWNGRTFRYYIPSTDNNAYYVGDIVLSAADGDIYGVPAVIKAAATDVPRGVIVGIEPVPPRAASLDGSGTNLAALFIPATKIQAYYILVCDDRDVIFQIQGDGTATNQVVTNGNKNAKVTVAAPSAGRPFSATVIDSSNIATTQAFMLKLMGLAQVPGNVAGAYAQWYCRFNQHELMGNTAGV